VKLFVDDTRTPPKHAGWTLARSVPEAQQILATQPVTHLSLDHDFKQGSPNGVDLVNWLVNSRRWPSQSLRVHSGNVAGAHAMKALIAQHAPAHLQRPGSNPYTAADSRLVRSLSRKAY
jgi:hypothetical protein